MTLTQLIAKYNELATAAGLATRKGFENKAKAEAAIAALSKTKKKASGAALRVRKAGAIHNPGPRGFKVGPVWLASIKSGKGVAMKPANRPKLIEHATSVGVSVTDEMAHADIVALVAKAI